MARWPLTVQSNRTDDERAEHRRQAIDRFSDRIREARGDRSQYSVVKGTAIKRSSLSRWETGTLAAPRDRETVAALAASLAASLGLPFEELWIRARQAWLAAIAPEVFDLYEDLTQAREYTPPGGLEAHERLVLEVLRGAGERASMVLASALYEPAIAVEHVSVLLRELALFADGDSEVARTLIEKWTAEIGTVRELCRRREG